MNKVLRKALELGELNWSVKARWPKKLRRFSTSSLVVSAKDCGTKSYPEE